ncbi:MAG: ABC transporter substrate-binding protein, partial [Casimicrobiaceae bacterium]
ALLETSKTMVDGKLIAKPLTWAQVKSGFAEAAPAAKTAYEKTGSKPDFAAFETKEAADLRGLPTWAMNRWPERA